MNWQHIYDTLIASRADNKPTGYSERHHILPRGLGGSDGLTNLVHLTAREHFVAHLLLARIYGGVMWLAVIRMKGRRFGDGYVNGRLYETARTEWAAWSSANQRGENHWAFGKPSPRRGVKRPEMSGSNHPLFGKKRTPAQTAGVTLANTGSKRSEDTKQRIGDAQRGSRNHAFGKPLSDEHRSKISGAMKERKLSDEHKRKIGEAHLGRVFSSETIEKMRAAALLRHARARGEL